MDVVDLVDGMIQNIILLFIIGKFYLFLCDFWFVCEIGSDWKYLFNKLYLEVFVLCVLYMIESNSIGEEEIEYWRLILIQSLFFEVVFLSFGEEW